MTPPSTYDIAIYAIARAAWTKWAMTPYRHKNLEGHSRSEVAELRFEAHKVRATWLRKTKGKRPPGFLQATGTWNYGNAHLSDQHVRDWKELQEWHSRGVVLARKLARRLKRITFPMPRDGYLPTGYSLLAQTWAERDRTEIAWHRTPRVETDIRHAYRDASAARAMLVPGFWE